MGNRRINLRPNVIKNFTETKEEKEVCHIADKQIVKLKEMLLEDKL